MIKINKFSKLGEANHGWLHARYHFSFSSYYNPDRMGFGTLRVINDDEIKANQGFPPHGHSNMEIITYVREGEVLHKDSIGNSGSTKAGDVQVMSAGTGIQHSEFSSKTTDTRLFQIWIESNQANVKPRWDAKTFPKDFASEALPLLVSGLKRDEGKGALFIYADAAIYGGRVKQGTEINMDISGDAYILSSKGSFAVNGSTLNNRDGAEVAGENNLKIRAESDSEIIIIELTKKE